MRFTKITLVGLTAIDLPLINALPSDKFLLKEVDGLGPPEVDVSITNKVYQGRQPQSREIVCKVGLNPDYRQSQVVGDLRKTLYGLLTPGVIDHVEIQIRDESQVLAKTTGYVSKFEPVMFSKDPEVQITIPCLEDYLQSPTVLYLQPENKSNPSILNLGDAPSGFHFEVIFNSDVPAPNWILSDPTGNKMNFFEDFNAGDKLEFDTREGFMGIWRTRNGVRQNIIYSLTKDSVWYKLHGGLNQFSTSYSDFSWGDVFYLPQYWGV